MLLVRIFFALNAFDVLCRGHPCLALEYFGKILHVGKAAAVGDVGDAGEALFHQRTGILDADCIQIFDDPDADVFFENVRKVFFVVGQFKAHGIQGKFLLGKMIIYIFFNQVDAVRLVGFVLLRQKLFAQK